MPIKKSLILISSVFLLSACSSILNKPSGNTDNLQGLQNLTAPAASINPKANTLSSMRTEALKDTAMTIGAQSGLHWRSDQINDMLMQHSKTLDTIYDFNALLLDHNVLPPVLTEARQTLNLDGPDVIRLEDRVYEIVSQAKFVTTAPTWRDYLWMNYPQPPVPDNSVLPHTKTEIEAWRSFVLKGWIQGIKQADEIYSENLSRLERDYDGMMLYRDLRAQNIVSAPFVSQTDLGVTGGGSDMSVNDQVLRITALPALEPNSNRWTPALSTPQPPLQEP